MATNRGHEGNFTVDATSTPGAADQSGYVLASLVTSTRPFQTQFDITEPDQDITGFASTAPTFMSYRAEGLGQWTAGFTAYYPNTPASGHEGNITYANGYTNKSDRFTLSLSSGTPLDDTAFAATPPTWRAFQCGGLWSGTGTYRARSDSGIAFSKGTAGEATFRMSDAAVDNTIAGAIVITGASSPIVIGGQIYYDYSFRFTGTIASAGSNTLFPDGDLTEPEETSITIRLNAGGTRTMKGNCFITTVGISVQIGSPIEVTCALQGTGALTPA